jgi:hypothetical protein
LKLKLSQPETFVAPVAGNGSEEKRKSVGFVDAIPKSDLDTFIIENVPASPVGIFISTPRQSLYEAPGLHTLLLKHRHLKTTHTELQQLPESIWTYKRIEV